MRRLSGLLFSVALMGLVVSCGPNGFAPEDAAPAAAAMGNPGTRWVSEYWTPLVPQYYGVRTYRCTAGECEGDEFTAELLEKVTVPYETGPLTGRWFRLGGSESLVSVEDKLFYWFGSRAAGATYYASIDCELTAPPPEVVWGSFVDGTIIDNSGTFFGVNKDDPADCISIDLPAPDGSVDSNVALMQIQDVQVGGKKYNNALLWWELEPYLPFRPLQFHGKELEFGITLPTGDETDGAAIDDVVIYGFHKGIVAIIGAELATGKLGDVWELVSIDRP